MNHSNRPLNRSQRRKGLHARAPGRSRPLEKPNNKMREMVSSVLPVLHRLYTHWLLKGIPNEHMAFVVARRDSMTRRMFDVGTAPDKCMEEILDMIVVFLPRQTIAELLRRQGSGSTLIFRALLHIKPICLGNDVMIALYDGTADFAGYLERDMGVTLAIQMKDGESPEQINILEQIFNDHVDRLRVLAREFSLAEKASFEDMVIEMTLQASADGDRPATMTEYAKGGAGMLNVSVGKRLKTPEFSSNVPGFAEIFSKPCPADCVLVIVFGFGAAVSFFLPLVDAPEGAVEGKAATGEQH